MMKADPDTAKEWQAAVDGAHGALVFHAARQYGLVTGGPKINVDRCQELLTRGRALGFEPSENAVEKFVVAITHA